MKKLFSYAIVGVILIGLIWYLFIKDYNHKITFEASHSPGTIYATLYNWSSSKGADIDSVILKDSAPYDYLDYDVHIGDSLFQYRWEIDRLNDSTSKITAYIIDPVNSFKQNITVPFKKTDFKKRNISTVSKMMNGLYIHEKEYKSTVIKGEEFVVPEQYCAYISLSSKIYQKGNTMISNIGLIMNYIKDNNILLTGDPFLKVTNWNLKEESIEYDFCFPIKELDSMPETKTIKFKKVQGFRALKAIFNGNYRLSDRAWYALQDYAESKNKEIALFPFEVYKNDPHSGGNELEWTAEIFMPLKD